MHDYLHCQVYRQFRCQISVMCLQMDHMPSILFLKVTNPLFLQKCTLVHWHTFCSLIWVCIKLSCLPIGNLGYFSFGCYILHLLGLFYKSMWFTHRKKVEVLKLFNLFLGTSMLVFLTFAMLFHFLCSLWALERKDFVFLEQAGQTHFAFAASSLIEIFIINMTCGVNVLIVYWGAQSKCELQTALVNEA